jgi:ferredoxin
MFHVWIDQDLCTGDGLCTDHCPEVFVLLEDGISYVRDHTSIGTDPGGRGSMTAVPLKLEQSVIDAALDCPGECIFIEVQATYDRRPPLDDEPASPMLAVLPVVSAEE